MTEYHFTWPPQVMVHHKEVGLCTRDDPVSTDSRMDISKWDRYLVAMCTTDDPVYTGRMDISKWDRYLLAMHHR